MAVFQSFQSFQFRQFLQLFRGKGRWPLLRRLRWLRISQYVLDAVIVAVNAYLVSVFVATDAQLGTAATVAIMVAGLSFVLTVIQQWSGTHLSGYRKRTCLSLFVLFDLICSGLQVPLVTVLATAGLPSNCHGIADGEDPSVFGPSGHGLTPRYCAVPNATFWMSLALMLSYIYTLSLVIRQIAAVSSELKQLRQEQKVLASNERITALVAAHQAPPRTWNRRQPNQVETVDLRPESVRALPPRVSEPVTVSPPAGPAVAVDSDAPPPYISAEPVRDLATSLGKN